MKIKMPVSEVAELCTLAKNIQPHVADCYDKMCDEYYTNTNALQWLRIQFKFFHPSLRFFNVGEYAITSPEDLKLAREWRECWHACYHMLTYIKGRLPQNGNLEVTLDEYTLSNIHTIEKYKNV